MNKPILCLDFDGTIHQYTRGWVTDDAGKGVVYDPAVAGFFDWAERAKEHFRLTVYSSRSKTEAGLEAMRAWLVDQSSVWCTLTGRYRVNEDRTVTDTDADDVAAWFAFAHEKPAAFLTIDDRAIQFRGDWSAWWLEPELLRQFRPWNVAGGLAACKEDPTRHPWSNMSAAELITALASREGVFRAVREALHAVENRGQHAVTPGQVRMSASSSSVLVVVDVLGGEALTRTVTNRLSDGDVYARLLKKGVIMKRFPTVVADLKKRDDDVTDLTVEG